MGGMARNSLKLDDGKGTKFYEFDDIANTKQFIEDWYSVPSKRWSEDVELLVLQVLFKFDALSRLPMEQWKEDAKHAVFALFHLSVALCLLKSTRPALPQPPN